MLPQVPKDSAGGLESGQMLQVPMQTGSKSVSSLCAVFEGWEREVEKTVFAGRG